MQTAEMQTAMYLKLFVMQTHYKQQIVCNVFVMQTAMYLKLGE